MNSTADAVAFRLEKITKRFGGLNALTEINLSIEEGQIMGLTSPNGADKTTLFNVATSIYKPDAGDIYLEEKKITGKSSYHLCRLGISRTFQLFKAFLSMTAFENVSVGAIYGHGLRGKEARALASKPLITLLDEPMAGLNPSEIMNMLRIFLSAACWQEKFSAAQNTSHRFTKTPAPIS
ncbi:MAG: ATP-binding cassette domain-containing protein [Desulfatiglandales bacterium]